MERNHPSSAGCGHQETLLRHVDPLLPMSEHGPTLLRGTLAVLVFEVSGGPG